MEIAEVQEFYDGYLDKLKTVNNRHQWVFNSIDRFIPQNINVLDIGCGTGITSKYLANGNRDVVAVDLSPVLIQYAKTNNQHERIKYIDDDIANLEYYHDEFDAILMVDVLEHILSASFSDLFNTLQSLSHESTKIYLNIPSADVIRFLKEHKPDSLQIVDNPIETGDILKMFSDIGFAPIYYQLYWQHYVEYLFVTKEEYTKTFSEAF